MATTAQHTVTLVQTLYDLMNNHQSGRAVEMRFCDVYRIRNGKIVNYRSYYDVFGFLQQLGLIPSQE